MENLGGKDLVGFSIQQVRAAEVAQRTWLWEQITSLTWRLEVVKYIAFWVRNQETQPGSREPCHLYRPKTSLATHSKVSQPLKMAPLAEDQELKHELGAGILHSNSDRDHRLTQSQHWKLAFVPQGEALDIEDLVVGSLMPTATGHTSHGVFSVCCWARLRSRALNLMGAICG